jgi:hypothetical protein
VTSCSALVSPLLAVTSCMSSVSTFPASYSSPPVVLGSIGRPLERFWVCRCSSGDRPGVEVIKLEGIGLDSQMFDHLRLGHSNDLGVEGCFGALKFQWKTVNDGIGHAPLGDGCLSGYHKGNTSSSQIVRSSPLLSSCLPAVDGTTPC